MALVRVPTREQTHSEHFSQGSGKQGVDSTGQGKAESQQETQPGRKPLPRAGGTEGAGQESRAPGPPGRDRAASCLTKPERERMGDRATGPAGRPGRTQTCPAGHCPRLPPGTQLLIQQSPRPPPPAEGRTQPLPIIRTPSRDPPRARTSLTNELPGPRWEVGRPSAHVCGPGILLSP